MAENAQPDEVLATHAPPINADIGYAQELERGLNLWSTFAIGLPGRGGLRVRLPRLHDQLSVLGMGGTAGARPAIDDRIGLRRARVTMADRRWLLPVGAPFGGRSGRRPRAVLAPPGAPWCGP
jgi:hypothetical protein